MSLDLATPPAGGAAVIAEALGALHPARRPAFGPETRAVAGAAPQLDLALPHRVYHFRLDRVLDKPNLHSAIPVAWRYLVVQEEKAVAAAEIKETAAGGRPEFLQLNRGAFPQSTVEALNRIEQMPALNEENFELRLLEVPALYLAALWLFSEAKSLVVPLAPAPHPFEPNAVLSEHDFWRSLRPLAEARLAAEGSDLRVEAAALR